MRHTIFFILLCSIGIISCKKEKNVISNHLSLDTRYLQIDQINSFADCIGPQGSYTTEVISKKNGELFFHQAFGYRDLPFMAKIGSNKEGYVINGDGEILDTLSNISIEMIRSHDFHRIQTNPNSFFDQIKFENYLENGIESYSGVDRLKNPIKIDYDRMIGQIRSIEFLNMMDTTEVIKIEYKKWTESNYGKLAKEVEIIQAKKDTFNFKFSTVRINE